MPLMRLNLRSLRDLAVLGSAALALAGCGGGGGPVTQGPPISVSLGGANDALVVVPQDGTPVIVKINITSTSETALVSVINLPSGVVESYAASDTNPSGTLKFTASASTPAGTYTPAVNVNSAGQTASANFTLVIAVAAKVSATVDTALGVKGELRQFMATSFQIAEWSGDYFGTGATATAREATLNKLGPQHIRMQPVSQGVPMVGHTGTAADWDFTLLDQTVQPILATGDHSPEFQVATAPAWMCNASGQLDVAAHVNDFAAYAANLVRYYNTGGFDWGGTHFQSPSSHTITWWGIFNEPVYNGIAPQQYVAIYNAVVPAMLKVDPTIKLSALEFSGSTLGTGWSSDPEIYLPPFFAPASAGGVNAQVDIVSNHYYSSCNQTDTDVDLFGTVPEYVAVEKYIYQEIATRPDLAGTPVWTTENNVNADYLGANGMSTCNPNQVFVTDTRGTSAFFAAWRPYVFSQFGKAGNQALYHWAYTGDQQYGEVDANGNYYLSYWVDRALDFYFPSTPSSPSGETGPSILSVNSTDTATVELLATKNSDGSVVVMVVDRAVNAAGDNNGPGAPRTVMVDVSSLGSFTGETIVELDAATNAAMGPVGASVPLTSPISVTLPGYGVAFVALKP
jgi:hypothetical protein